MKNIFSASFITIFSLAFCLLNVNAQTTSRQISGGVLNGKAIEFPKPEYPSAAKAINAGGQVLVEVIIDEEGKTSEAKAVSGHPLLRKVSEDAALKAKFKPTYLRGEVVKVSGVIIYNFLNTKETENPKPTSTDKDEVIISLGVLNIRAKHLEIPPYPPAAKAIRAMGDVNVYVTINEEGKVSSAEATSGHPLLRSSSVNAALKSTFKPALIQNKPVKGVGVIIYRYRDFNNLGDFLFEKAIVIPQPSYPTNVDKTKVSGDVRVQVTIDKEGNVISAKAVSGNPVFYEVSEKAAKEAKFNPTELNGEKVEITGILTYKFIPENK